MPTARSTVILERDGRISELRTGVARPKLGSRMLDVVPGSTFELSPAETTALVGWAARRGEFLAGPSMHVLVWGNEWRDVPGVPGARIGTFWQVADLGMLLLTPQDSPEDLLPPTFAAAARRAL